MAENGKGMRAQRFEGKVAVVTGAASGIGQETAIRFGREGAKVAICDINMDGLEQTRRCIEEAGGEALAMKVDQRILEQVETFIQATLEKFGAVHILVNNAGTGQFSPFAFVSDEEYERIMDINVRGPFYFARAVLPGMMDQDFGRIVNVTSIMSKITGQGQSIYSASKGALMLMTQGIAVDCSGYNITANALGPGMVLTGLTRNMLGDPDQVTYFTEKTPLRRVAKPEDIAPAILFLCSEEGSFINGTSLFVDGGMTCTNL